MVAIAVDQKRIWWVANWLSIFLISAILSTADVAHADIYIWEDNQGVIHYSNQDVPSEASLYMRETTAPSLPEPAETPPVVDREAFARESRELARKQNRAQQRLEEANRKLNDALERVENLTDSVARSRAEAAAAADAARQAEVEARAARDDRNDEREQVTVYAVPYRPYRPSHHYKNPYRYSHQKHTYKYKKRRTRHQHRDKRITSHHIRRKSRIENFGTHRGNRSRYNIPGPILPPDSHRIPSAYGIHIKR